MGGDDSRRQGLRTAINGGGWGRQGRTTKATAGGVIMVRCLTVMSGWGRRRSKQRQGFSSYVTCIVFLSKKITQPASNLFATC